MIPFYIFYSMFGFQRTGDSIWAMADQLARGFLIGATAGRTTLTGEGLQHADGHSPLLAATNPAVVHYDPAFAYEVSHIMQAGLERMYGDDEHPRRGRHLLPHRLQRAGRAARRSRRTSTSRASSRASTRSRPAEGDGPAGAAARLRRRLPVDHRRPQRMLAEEWGVARRHLVGHLVERAGPRRRRGRGVEPPAPRRGARARRTSPTSWPAPTGPVVAVSRLHARGAAARSPAGCPATTACSAPTASASPTPARPPAASSTSTPSRSSSQALAGARRRRRGRAARWSQEAFDEVPHRRPDRRRRRQAGGRRRLSASAPVDDGRGSRRRPHRA